MEAVSITTSISKLFGTNIITFENQKEVATMNAQRAQEIASSPTMANVIYNGENIYIEHVDEQNGTATIHSLDEPNNKQSVSVTSLNEQ
jgi:small acid-soluble spore protein H (minor)